MYSSAPRLRSGWVSECGKFTIQKVFNFSDGVYWQVVELGDATRSGNTIAKGKTMTEAAHNAFDVLVVHP